MDVPLTLGREGLICGRFQVWGKSHEESLAFWQLVERRQTICVLTAVATRFTLFFDKFARERVNQ